MVGARGVEVVGDFFPRRLHDAIVSLDEPVIARGAARRFLGRTHMPHGVVLDAAGCVCHKHATSLLPNGVFKRGYIFFACFLGTFHIVFHVRIPLGFLFVVERGSVCGGRDYIAAYWGYLPLPVPRHPPNKKLP